MHQQTAAGQPNGGSGPAASRGGLTFSEVMAGPFSFGADGSASDEAGAGRGSRLTLRASLTIPDVARFVADPEHAGALCGTITAPDRHMIGVPASGWFKLFAPAAEAPLKLMIYRAAFEHDGAPYTLHGVKEVGRGSVLHAWGETTTLKCRLYRGTEASGPACGGGTLRITAGGFARQLLSFRVLSGATASAKVRALSAFFLFFSRELVDTYF
jgi:cholesterol oxidase